MVAAHLDNGGVNLLHQDFGGAVGRHPAPIQDREFVAAFGLIHVVGGHENGRTTFDQVEQALPEFPPALRINRAGGFVQQQQRRPMQRGRRQRQPLTLAAAHRPRPLAAQLLEPVFLAGSGNAFPSLPTRQPVDLGDKSQVLIDREVVVEREALGHVPEAATDRLGFPGGVVPHDGYVALRRPQ
jgi:hypothetical protein